MSAPENVPIATAWRRQNLEVARAREKAWKAANPEKVKAMAAKIFARNKARIYAQCKARRDAESPERKEQRLARVRAWKADNKSKVTADKALYKKENPHKVAEWGRDRRARENNVKERFTEEQKNRVLAQFKNKCFACGSAADLVIDHHYPLVLGYPLAYGNAVCLCRRCNGSKNCQDPKVFYTPFGLKRVNAMLDDQIEWE